MRRSNTPAPAVAVCLLLGVSACKRGDADKSAATGESEQAKVERMCEDLNALSLAYVAGVVDMDIDGDGLKQPEVKAKLREACKGLSLEVVECARKLALTDPKCDRALEQAMGMTDSRPQGEGPAPSWSLKLPFEIYDIAPTAAGVVAVAGERALAWVVSGELKWQVELDEASSQAAWLDACILTGAGAELRCYAESGEVAWSRELAPKDDGVWLSAIEAGPEPGQATVITSAGEIVRIDAAACRVDAAAEGCARELGRVEAIGGMHVSLLPGGALLGSSDEGIALVSATGELLAERAFDYETSFPAGALVVGGHDILRAKPDCAANSDACFEVLASDKDLELAAPLELPGGDLILVDRYGVIQRRGARKWEIDAGNDGDPILHRGALYSVGHVLGLDKGSLDAPPQLRAVDPETGETHWITALGSGRAGLLDGYILEAAGDLVFAATKQELFAVPVAAGD